jgi:hypothetical protein
VGSDSYVSDPTAPVVIVEDSVPSVEAICSKKNREAIFCTSSARGFPALSLHHPRPHS